MPTFRNGSVEIAYLDEGEGDPIVLVHGFASNARTNWVQPGWVSTLTRAGRRVVALDNRGHGQSSKLYNDADYHTDLMAGEYKNPLRVIAFNTHERWSEDVSEDVAREIRRRFDLQLADVPSNLQDFVERHEGHHRQLALRLA